jgi:hypothetical protein
LNFAVCVDANAGARAQARAQAAAKDARYKSDALKFFNREVTLERTQQQNIIGLSKDQSDAYAQALATQGKGRRTVEDAAKAYFTKMPVNEGGRSRRFGKLRYLELLQKNADVEATVQNVFGRNMAYSQEGIKRVFQAKQASAREALGIRPEYGAPVMMPPTNRLGGALQIASQVAGIVSAFSSDIKLKENIEEVGLSPDGYKIYEFNYKGFKDRWRGAMAQDVVKKNPMAVGIQNNYLTVDYSKIDVNMELV